MAQVFSVNAVGYVNKTIPKSGFALVSNPLKAATNTVNALFAGVPGGTQVFVYSKEATNGLIAGFNVGTYDDLDGAFLPAAVGNSVVLPGGGVFVKNPTTTDLPITFVGEVPQGHLVTDLKPGLQIVSSQVPQAGTAKDLGMPSTTEQGLSPGDQLYQFNVTTQKYDVSTFDDLENGFLPALKSLDVGDAVFLKLSKAATWTRDFNVNQ
jgi:hypothetical protein